jgi:sugar phosphate isomerase/epimerase
MLLSYVLSTQPTQFQAVAFAPDLEANIMRLAELGYDGVELAVREPAMLNVQDVRRMIDKYKMRPRHRYRAGLCRRKTVIHRHRRVHPLERHPARGIPYLPRPRIQLHRHHRTRSRHGTPTRFNRCGARPSLVDALRSLTRAASAQNVRLAIEPINRYETNLLNTVGDTLALIDKVSADNLGILFDTFHANIEEPHMEASLLSCGSRLFHVHIADSNRWAAGFGHTDFEPIIATLHKMKYSGWLSAEILPKPDMETAQEQAIKTMRAVI